jgi:hypothetical protein
MSVLSMLFKPIRTQRSVRVRYRAIIKLWHGQFRRLLHPYRPEFHYMRGPGPKCREKQTKHPTRH